MTVVDADAHLFEPLSVYVDYTATKSHSDAIHVAEDDRGWPWLVCKGRRLHFVDDHVPGRPDLLGARRRHYLDGNPPLPLSDLSPAAYDPTARVDLLDRVGTDQQVVFPNLGLLWEDCLRDDVSALCANLTAANRWAVEQYEAGRGRLHPVAHLTLRDLEWFEQESQTIARAGLRFAMIGPNPIGRLSLADPSFDRVWRIFEDLGIAICFHVAQFQRPLDPAWTDLDPEPLNKVLDSTFLHLAPAVTIASWIIHGVLERFPKLRIGVMELSARWVPEFLLHLDGAFEFYRLQNGRPLTELDLAPSEYFRRQVRVAAFPAEMPADLIASCGPDVFMWCSDYPHAEGMETPSWDEYERRQPRELVERERAALAGRNAEFLLGG